MKRASSVERQVSARVSIRISKGRSGGRLQTWGENLQYSSVLASAMFRQIELRKERQRLAHGVGRRARRLEPPKGAKDPRLSVLTPLSGAVHGLGMCPGAHALGYFLSPLRAPLCRFHWGSPHCPLLRQWKTLSCCVRQRCRVGRAFGSAAGIQAGAEPKADVEVGRRPGGLPHWRRSRGKTL